MCDNLCDPRGPVTCTTREVKLSATCRETGLTAFSGVGNVAVVAPLELASDATRVLQPDVRDVADKRTEN